MTRLPSRHEARNYVKNMATEITEYVKENIYPQFVMPQIQVYYFRHASTAGGTKFDANNMACIPFIRISVMECFFYPDLLEYDHYEDDPEIGSCKSDNWKHSVALRVAHEMAHAVQFYHLYKSNRRIRVPAAVTAYYAGIDDGHHGKDFQYIYRIIRNKFVNNQAYEEVS